MLNLLKALFDILNLINYYDFERRYFLKKISDENLELIKGGSASVIVGVGLVVIAAIVFISGVFEGFTNPRRCNNEVGS